MRCSQRAGEFRETKGIFEIVLLNMTLQADGNAAFDQQPRSPCALVECSSFAGDGLVDFRVSPIDADLDCSNAILCQTVRHLFVNKVSVGVQIEEEPSRLGMGNDLEQVSSQKDFATSQHKFGTPMVAELVDTVFHLLER